MKHGEVKFQGFVVFPASLFEFESLFFYTSGDLYGSFHHQQYENNT